MKCSFLVLLLLAVLPARAQLAVINDPDGFVNVREGAGTDQKVMQQLKNGTIVFCFEKKGNWMNIDFMQAKDTRNGFVYADRIRPIEEFTEFKQVMDSIDRAILKLDSISIELTRRAFNKARHKFTYSKENPELVEKIDGREYYGTDGFIPTMAYGSVSITIGKKHFTLPPAALDNLYEPNVQSTMAYYDAPNETLYIYALNSDGGGGYYVIWKIEKGRYVERAVFLGF